MEANRHQGKSLKYITIEPDGYDPEMGYPLVVLLHGFGASMEDLAGLCPAIDRSGYLYVCPNAPLEFQLGPGMVGYGWTLPRSEGTSEDVRRVVEQLDQFTEEVIEQYHTPPGQAVLMGFSQGGTMSLRCGLPKPDTFAGLGALSCYLNEPEDLKDSLPDKRDQSVFMAHGVYDEMASVEMARKTKDFLEGQGYAPSYHEYPIAHEISPEVLADVVAWLKKTLPPRVS